MLNIIIFGPPGSGKGTQSAKIVEKYNLVHLSTGDLMREEIAKDSPLGREVKKFIDKGMLVPDEIIMRELYDKASEHLDSPGLIFDGFPRTIVQAEMLDQMLNKHGIPIDVVLSVDVNEEELFKRLMGRAEDSGRSDDTADIIWQRIEVYKEQTFPLIDFYKKQGKIVSINGMSPVDKVFGKITKAVDTYLETKEIIPEVL
jgi:adenylate kinase